MKLPVGKNKKKLHSGGRGDEGSCFGILKELYEANILPEQKLSRTTLVKFKQNPLCEYSYILACGLHISCEVLRKL